jgi:hypothetical protein
MPSLMRLIALSMAAAGTMLLATVPAHAAPARVAAPLASAASQPGSFEVAYQASDGNLATYGPANGSATADLGLAMMPGSSPAIALLPVGFEEAYQAADSSTDVTGASWRGGAFGPVQGAISPAIVPLPGGSGNGGLVVAGKVQDDLATNNFVTFRQTNTGQGIKPGISPAMAAMPGGTFEVAFQASNGHMWTYSPVHGVHPLGLGMMAGTSPAIAAQAGGSYVVAFQANTGYLWTYSSTSGPKDLGLGMKAGTSPAITALAGGGYEIAFQANTGYLWTYSSARRATDLSLGMKAATSPAISGLPGSGYAIAFQANTGVLWVHSSAAGNLDTGLAMKAGTSPAIVGYSPGACPRCTLAPAAGRS